ncbi:MarR family transcriptional regulator [Sphingomonas sediminicola]
MSRLAQLSGTSKATALRWIDYLLDRGLISRQPHPTDLRTAFVELTDKGGRSLRPTSRIPLILPNRSNPNLC